MTETNPNPNGSQKGGTEGKGTGTGPGLNELLAEFERNQSAAKPSELNALLGAMKPIAEYAETSMRRDRETSLNNDVENAVKFMQEAEEAKALPKRMVRGYVEAYAIETPSFKEAFINRGTNPDGWQQALSKARESLVEEVKPLAGGKIRSDVNAALASVAGRTGAVPDRSEVPTRDLVQMALYEPRKWERYKQGLLTE